MRRSVLSGIGVLATVAALAAAWWFLAPPELGGRTSYAVVFGVSMEPKFHRGDLVVLRSRPSYAVGDIVAYRSHDLHKNVLHRIVAEHDGRYSFKGDNNDFVDPEQPSAADLVGSEWLHVPAVGAWLQDLHTPRNAAIAAGLIVLLLAAGGGSPAARRRRGRRKPHEETPRAPRHEPSGVAPSLGFAVAAAGAGALAAAAALGLLAYTRPLERSLVWANLYVQHGRFSYAAPVRRGATYQSPRVGPGDPVYLKLVHRLPVAFSYRLEATRPGPIAGAAGMTAVLHDDGGWSHTLVLAPPRHFAGRTASVHGVLDLERLRRIVTAFERETGEHNTLYHVRLGARVRVHGTVAARPLRASFAPTLTFDLDQLRLSVPAASDPSAPANPFEQSAGGAGTRVEPASLHALGRSVTVQRARRLATLLGLAGLALAGVGALLMLLGRRGHEVAAIRRRYEDWIVDVAPGERSAAAERRVASMDALARLAERYDRLILHEHRDDGDAFLVEDDGIVYAYVVRTWDRPLAVAR